MKVQKIYENALAIVGKTEEGTAYHFMERVPSLLNPDIAILNLFRGEDNQLAEITKISDDRDFTSKEAHGLSLCLACIAAEEVENFSQVRLAQLLQQRNKAMGAITTDMAQITEQIGV